LRGRVPLRTSQYRLAHIRRAAASTRRQWNSSDKEKTQEQRRGGLRRKPIRARGGEKPHSCTGGKCRGKSQEKMKRGPGPHEQKCACALKRKRSKGGHTASNCGRYVQCSLKVHGCQLVFWCGGDPDNKRIVLQGPTVLRKNREKRNAETTRREESDLVDP